MIQDVFCPFYAIPDFAFSKTISTQILRIKLVDPAKYGTVFEASWIFVSLLTLLNVILVFLS
jgi:hypothetical protein